MGRTWLVCYAHFVHMNTLRKRRFPLWLAVMAILGVSLLPLNVPATGLSEKHPACAHSASDGTSADLPCCEGTQASKSCTGEDMACTHFCSALIYAPVLRFDAGTSPQPDSPANQYPSWLEQPPHPPPKG